MSAMVTILIACCSQYETMTEQLVALFQSASRMVDIDPSPCFSLVLPLAITCHLHVLQFVVYVSKVCIGAEGHRLRFVTFTALQQLHKSPQISINFLYISILLLASLL